MMCSRCGQEFTPKYAMHKYCSECPASLRDKPCEPVDEITALSKRCAELEAALEKIARGTSITFDKHPQQMSGYEARDIASAALEAKP